MPPDPPHPGSQPELFEFPFEEARAAVRAIRDAQQDVTLLVRRNQAAADQARVGWHGLTRRQFDHSLGQLADDYEAAADRLGGHADALEADIATAEVRREASLDARAAWGRQLDAYQQAQTADAS